MTLNLHNKKIACCHQQSQVADHFQCFPWVKKECKAVQASNEDMKLVTGGQIYCYTKYHMACDMCGSILMVSSAFSVFLLKIYNRNTEWTTTKKNRCVCVSDLHIINH